MHPASATNAPLALSKLMTRFMAWVDSSISSKTGTPPPTRPVLPPCGVAGARASENVSAKWLEGQEWVEP